MSQLCVGDLLRHEASSGSSLGSEISDLMQHGKIVPGEITMRLLHQALQTLASTSSSSSSIVLIDGFPRAMDQALQFEQSVTAPEFVLFFDCADEQLTTRMRARRAKSGKLGKGKVRDDDVESVFVKRLQTFRETTMPVVGYYKERNKVKMIDAGENQTPESVFQQTRPLFEQLLREIDDDDDEQEDEQLQEKQEEEDSQEQGQTAEQTV